MTMHKSNAQSWSLALLAGLLVLGSSFPASAQQDYAARMAQEHRGDRPVATAAAETSPRNPVSSRRVTYANLDGQPVEGYLAEPRGADGPLPGLIVIQEWWGLNENIEAMARRLAGEGYRALAVDLYGGEVAETREEAFGLMSAAMSNRAAAEENLKQAAAYLKDEGKASSLGVIGWCFGGMWSWTTARLLGDEVSAAVVYYGRLSTDASQLRSIQAPILGLFGAEDNGIPVAAVRNFEKALNELGKSVEIHIYEGANHAFANPSGERYNAAAAEDAWAKTLAFFAKHLQGG